MTVDAADAVWYVWRRRFRRRLWRLASLLAVDPGDTRDYLQEALLLLWEMDPTRFDPRAEEEWLRMALRQRMQRRGRGGRRQQEVRWEGAMATFMDLGVTSCSPIE